MRVAHIITRLIVGGAQENTIATVLGLREKPDCHVTLISGPTTGPEGSLEPAVRHIPELLVIVPDLVRPVHPVRDLRALYHLGKLLRTFKPDIVHTHSGKAGILGRIAAHRAGIPIIVHSVHGPSFGHFQSALPNAVFQAAERYAARFTTHFIVVAQAMARLYLAAGIGKPHQYSRIWSGFELQPFLHARNDPALRARWNIDPNDFVVGKIARFFNLKGHDDLFAAAPEILERCPNAKFLLVGDGLLRPQFESRAKQLGLSERFVFTGLLPPDDIPSVIGIMDLLVHLSQREGLARALPQALAAAKPVVTYDCGGAAEVCIDGQTGFLLSPGDRQGLVERVSLLGGDAELRNRLGKMGQQLVRESFSVERMVEDQYSLYRRLIA